MSCHCGMKAERGGYLALLEWYEISSWDNKGLPCREESALSCSHLTKKIFHASQQRRASFTPAWISESSTEIQLISIKMRRGLISTDFSAAYMDRTTFSFMVYHRSLKMIQNNHISSPLFNMKLRDRDLDVPGPQDKRLTGNGEKLTYSCPAGCNWPCLASV